ncbi:hypothetical protein [Devosia sp. CAU 1758]
MRAALFLLPSVLLAAPVLAEEVACEGAFGIDSSEARLIEIYGAENVRTGIVPGPEGTEMLATLVYPDDLKREIMFVWWDEEGRKDPSYIELSAKMTAPGGLRAGFTVPQVEELNGEPFTLNGFGWDYGGAAGFQSGNLADIPGGCHISVSFSPRLYPSGIDTDPIMGDVEVSSSNPLLEDVGARIDWVSIGYPHPDYRE